MKMRVKSFVSMRPLCEQAYFVGDVIVSCCVYMCVGVGVGVGWGVASSVAPCGG
jgi:hypothetical protein